MTGLIETKRRLEPTMTAVTTTPENRQAFTNLLTIMNDTRKALDIAADANPNKCDQELDDYCNAEAAFISCPAPDFAGLLAKMRVVFKDHQEGLFAGNTTTAGLLSDMERLTGDATDFQPSAWLTRFVEGGGSFTFDNGNFKIIGGPLDVIYELTILNKKADIEAYLAQSQPDSFKAALNAFYAAKGKQDEYERDVLTPASKASDTMTDEIRKAEEGFDMFSAASAKSFRAMLSTPSPDATALKTKYRIIDEQKYREITGGDSHHGGDNSIYETLRDDALRLAGVA